MRRDERGTVILTLLVVVVTLAVVLATAVPATTGAFHGIRAAGAVASLYGAIHLTRARARATGVTHALVLEADGRGFRIVRDPGGERRIVEGPHALVDGVVATGNVVLQFSPKGFAVPAGTITVQSGDEVRRLVVNLLGRVRIARGPGPT